VRVSHEGVAPSIKRGGKIKGKNDEAEKGGNGFGGGGGRGGRGGGLSRVIAWNGVFLFVSATIQLRGDGGEGRERRARER